MREREREYTHYYASIYFRYSTTPLSLSFHRLYNHSSHLIHTHTAGINLRGVCVCWLYFIISNKVTRSTHTGYKSESSNNRLPIYTGLLLHGLSHSLAPFIYTHLRLNISISNIISQSSLSYIQCVIMYM